jgi:hypothetical protein
MNRRSSRRSRRPHGPPQDVPWAWLTQEMMSSPAWQAMPLSARRALDRLLLEHMAHAGRENGNLIVTFDDFVKDGVGSRSAAARAVRILEALGFVDITIRGHRSFGGAHLPSRYALTWLPRSDGTLATDKMAPDREASGGA